MFLGFDDSLKSLKRDLKDAGVDFGFIRQWQKNYDKVRVQAPVLESQYQVAKQELQTVLSLIMDMEQQLIAGTVSKESLAVFSKEMKKYQGHFNQEFLIGKADTDFQTTYVSIIKLCDKDMNVKGNALILQSEIENLMAVIKEAMGKEWPDFKALAFFYIERTDRELTELPHPEKTAKVKNIYEAEFNQPFRNALAGRINAIRIKEILEVELWN
jgi:hypothetical protein